MTSFINVRYGNVAVGQPSVIRLLWAKALSVNAIQSEMCPVYGDKYFTRPAVHVWYKTFANGRESVVDEEELGRSVVSTTDATIAATIAAVDALMRSNRRVMG